MTFTDIPSQFKGSYLKPSESTIRQIEGDDGSYEAVVLLDGGYLGTIRQDKFATTIDLEVTMNELPIEKTRYRNFEELVAAVNKFWLENAPEEAKLQIIWR